ncbi:MAG: hypothetical protein KME60_03220 [Cyanomargarita calcarea GSE-NOS-MK-12-04C]|jgi:hypothetical protein|uniref:Uncharacterized protein n=1 Tax=Cyanomargarita calcarea GSE-NOS-MK-12-04C TaxID=2839659 RepID=A0A951QJG1_9CYAN|nr:hypothetical protein [Cyanomargarita calcarea GSE-NOS-MK-12-04C]
MAKKDYSPAEAVKLYIGDLEFDAIRITETSEYRMSQSQVLKAISVAKYYLARLPYHAPDKARRLASKGFTWVSLAVKYYDGKQSRYAETLSLDDAFTLWRFEDKNDNVKAEIILDALGKDSLRDRFDQVYGTCRTIEQRREDDNRIMDKPRKSHPLFGDKNMDKVASFLKSGTQPP